MTLWAATISTYRGATTTEGLSDAAEHGHALQLALRRLSSGHRRKPAQDGGPPTATALATASPSTCSFPRQCASTILSMLQTLHQRARLDNYRATWPDSADFAPAFWTTGSTMPRGLTRRQFPGFHLALPTDASTPAGAISSRRCSGRLMEQYVDALEEEMPPTAVCLRRTS